MMSTRIRSCFDENRCFFITTTFQNWLHLFIDDNAYRIVEDSLAFCCQKYKARIGAFVFMPSHIHLLLYFDEESRCSDFMRDFKKYSSVMLRRHIAESGDATLLESLRFERGNQMFKVWMSRFHCIALRDYRVIQTKVEYIHNSPVKARLVETSVEYKWSSAQWYLSDENHTSLPWLHLAELM